MIQKLKPSWIDEFKKFALKGNVVDMAVGVIIGGAFAMVEATGAINSGLGVVVRKMRGRELLLIPVLYQYFADNFSLFLRIIAIG